MQRVGRLQNGSDLVLIEKADRENVQKAFATLDTLDGAFDVIASLLSALVPPEERVPVSPAPPPVIPLPPRGRRSASTKSTASTPSTKPAKANVRDACVLILQASEEPLTTAEIVKRFKPMGIKQRSTDPVGATTVCLCHHKKIFKGVGSAPGKGHAKLWTLVGKTMRAPAPVPSPSTPPPATGKPDRLQLIRERLAKIDEQEGG